MPPFFEFSNFFFAQPEKMFHRVLIVVNNSLNKFKSLQPAGFFIGAKILQAPVFKTLNIPAVQKYVGTNPARIYAFGKAVQNTQTPYITWQVISTQPYRTLSQAPKADRVTVQIDCWVAQGEQGKEGTQMTTANALAMSVRNALDDARVHNEVSLQTVDIDANLFRTCFTANFLVAR